MRIIEIIDSITAAQWITIGVAFIAPLIALFGVWYTNRTTRKITQKNIDANLIAKARIEWIQNVRHAVTVFIAACYELLVLENDTDKTTKLSELREKTQLLILYFGPEKQTNPPVDLLCENSNEGKNAKVIDLINEIKDYLINDKQLVLERLDTNKQIIQSQIEEENAKLAGEDYYEHQPDYLEVLNEGIESIGKREIEYRCLFEKIESLSNVMRIYLKLEWNQAKSGK